MFPRNQRTLTLLSLTLVPCALFHTASAVPGPSPLEIFGANDHWSCPPADGDARDLLRSAKDDTSVTCIYSAYPYGAESACTYLIDDGSLRAWDAEYSCPGAAVAAPHKRRHETNFTALEEKIRARAEVPRAAVPSYMHTHRHLRRLRSGPYNLPQSS